ncbi:MAG: hypothetical protein RR202_11430 [Bacteroidales bacterium]
MKLNKGLPLFAYCLLSVFLLFSCGKKNRVSEETKEDVITELTKSTLPITNSIFYLENSGSMLGYVATGGSDFVRSVAEIVSKSDFNDTDKKYFLINAVTTPLGDSKQKFNQALSPTGMRQGNIADSDLVKMISQVMNHANDSSISILITDAIFSIQNKSKSLIENQLITKSGDTKTEFYNMLSKWDMQTILIKMNSHFKGNYYTASGSRIAVDHNRPYYIWIFGPSAHLSTVFNSNYIETLPGYEAMSRFLLLDKENEVNFAIVNNNRKGKFKQSKKDPALLTFEGRDRNTKEFQFSVAIDLSHIPCSNEYFKDPMNYSISSNYELIEIAETTDVKFTQKLSFTPTHLLTFRATQTPFGELSVALLSDRNKWVEESSNIDDSIVDSYSTFGFSYLVEGVRRAYHEKQGDSNLLNFKITVNK